MSYDDFGDEYADTITRQARTANVAALDADPEEASRALELSHATGVPATAIYGDVDGFERQNKAALGSAIIGDNLHIADYLNSDPMAARVSHDDLAGLNAASDAADGLHSQSLLSRVHSGLMGIHRALDLNILPEDAPKIFGQGFGQISSEAYQRFYHGLAPDEIDWALRHPAAAPFMALAGQVFGAGQIGMEGLARTIGGMVGLGHETIRKNLGATAANDFAAMADWAMTGQAGIHLPEVPEVPAATPRLRVVRDLSPKQAESIGRVLSFVDAAEKYAAAGREPGVGVHPYIDEIKQIEAKNDSDAVKEMYRTGDASATQGRSPDMMAQFWRGKIGEREIGIDAAAIQKLYGDKLPASDDGMLGWVPDLKNQIDLAVPAGDKIQVPLADWLAHTDPEVRKTLHDDLQFREGGITLNEIEGLKDRAKTSIADPNTLIRAEGGFEPLFALGDRKLSLLKTGEVAEEPAEPWAGPAKGTHQFDINDETGEKVGNLELRPLEEGKSLFIDWIGGLGGRGPQDFGPSLTRDIWRQLKALYPDAERVGGYRVTGARDKAGATNMAWVKLEEGGVPQGWDKVEPIQEVLQGAWQRFPGTGIDVLKPHEPTLEYTHLDEAIRRELERMVPKKLGGITTGIGLRTTTREGKVSTSRGLHQRFLERLPEIFVSLADPERAMGTAVHEGIHHLRQYGFFDDREWATLEAASHSEGWQKFIAGRYGDYRAKGNVPKLNEEAVAEGYRNWRLGRLKVPEGVEAVFRKIQDFVANVKIRYKELAGKDLNWDEIFRKVESGEVGQREGTRPLMEQGHQPFDPQLDEPAEGLFEKGRDMGVTQSHMNNVLRRVGERNAEDMKKNLARAEKQQKRTQTTDWKEKRTAMRDEVRGQLEGRPDIATDRLFTQQKIKLHPSTLSEEQKAMLPKEYVQAKDGVNPDDLAPYFGYASGDALVERLGLITEDRKRANMSHRDYVNRLIDTETDRRMNQQFGNLNDKIMQEAKDQALSESQVNLVHEETLAYGTAAGVETPINLRDMKAAVAADFDKLRVGNIKSARMIQNTGVIGRKIEAAGAAGKWSEAYRLMQQRLYSTLRSKLAVAYEKQRAALDQTAKTLRKRQPESISAEYTNWLHDLLQRAGYPINRSLQDLAAEIGRKGETTLQDFVEAKMAEWQGMRDLPIDPMFLDPSFRMKVDDMTYDQFVKFKSAIDGLRKAGMDEKKIYVQGEARDLLQTKAEMRQKLATFGLKISNLAPKPVALALRMAVYGMTAKETTFNRWDRGDPLGIFNKTLSYPFARAAGEKDRILRETAQKLGEIDRPKPQDLKKLMDSPVTDPATRTLNNPDGSGTWEGFNRGNGLQMLNHVGNISNLQKLAQGYGIDANALWNWLVKNFSKEDWDRAQAAGDIYEGLAKESHQVYERQTGMGFETIPLEPFKVRFPDGRVGEYRGWYHPLKGDPARRTAWRQKADGTWEQLQQGAKEDAFEDNYFHAATANGYTKARTHAIYPLNLDFNMVPTTLRQMIHDIAYREVITETQKIFKDRAFQDDVAKYYGQEYADGLMPYLKKLAGAEGIQGRNIAYANNLLSKFRQNIISTYIWGNLGTVAKHGPTAWAMSMRGVGVKPFLKARFGMTDLEQYRNAVQTLYGKAPAETSSDRAFMMSSSNEIPRRDRHWQDTLGAQKNEFVGDSNSRDKMIQLGSKAVAWSDKVSAEPTWIAEYDKQRQAGLSHGDATDLADRAVRRQHGSTAETNLPPAASGQGELGRFLTSLYGFFGTAMQRRFEMAYKINDAYKLGREGDLRQAAKAMPEIFNDFMTYVVWPTVVEEAVRSISTEDKRAAWKRALSAGTMGVSSSMLYIRDLVYGVTSGHEPGAGLLSAFGHDAESFVRHLEHPSTMLNKQHAGKFIEDTVTILGDLTGKSPKAIGKAAHFGLDVATGQQRPQDIGQVIRGVMTGQAKRRPER